MKRLPIIPTFFIQSNIPITVSASDLCDLLRGISFITYQREGEK